MVSFLTINNILFLRALMTNLNFQKNGSIQEEMAILKPLSIKQICYANLHIRFKCAQNHTVGGNNSKEAMYVPTPATATCSCIFHM